MQCVYLCSFLADCLVFSPLVYVQALRGRPLWQSIRGSVQLWCQCLRCGWNRSHAVCLRAAHSAVSYEKSYHTLMSIEQCKYLVFVCLLVSSLPPCCARRDGWKGFRLQRLYFVWVCREFQSFYWFAELLCALHHKVSDKTAVGQKIHFMTSIAVCLWCMPSIHNGNNNPLANSCQGCNFSPLFVV